MNRIQSSERWQRYKHRANNYSIRCQFSGQQLQCILHTVIRCDFKFLLCRLHQKKSSVKQGSEQITYKFIIIKNQIKRASWGATWSLIKSIGGRAIDLSGNNKYLEKYGSRREHFINRLTVQTPTTKKKPISVFHFLTHHILVWHRYRAHSITHILQLMAWAFLQSWQLNSSAYESWQFISDTWQTTWGIWV